MFGPVGAQPSVRAGLEMRRTDSSAGFRRAVNTEIRSRTARHANFGSVGLWHVRRCAAAECWHWWWLISVLAQEWERHAKLPGGELAGFSHRRLEYWDRTYGTSRELFQLLRHAPVTNEPPAVVLY